MLAIRQFVSHYDPRPNENVPDSVGMTKIIADAASRLVHDKLKDRLKAEAIKNIPSFRAKERDSLKTKLEKRNKEYKDKNNGKDKYSKPQDINKDIKDFAGAAVAVYFPDDIEPVGKVIEELFTIEKKIIHPKPEDAYGDEELRPHFDQYCAVHYVVKLPRVGLGRRVGTAAIPAPAAPPGPDSRVYDCCVEIQVATVLMRAWATVNHDLGYKSGLGDPTEDEKRVLKLLNGLVLTGEVALRQLHAATDARLGWRNRNFEDQFELLNYIRNGEFGVSNNATFGDALTLFHVVRSIGVDNPKQFDSAMKGWKPDQRVARLSHATSMINHLLGTLNQETDFEPMPVHNDPNAKPALVYGLLLQEVLYSFFQLDAQTFNKANVQVWVNRALDLHDLLRDVIIEGDGRADTIVADGRVNPESIVQLYDELNDLGEVAGIALKLARLRKGNDNVERINDLKTTIL